MVERNIYEKTITCEILLDYLLSSIHYNLIENLYGTHIHLRHLLNLTSQFSHPCDTWTVPGNLVTTHNSIRATSCVQVTAASSHLSAREYKDQLVRKVQTSRLVFLSLGLSRTFKSVYILSFRITPFFPLTRGLASENDQLFARIEEDSNAFSSQP